MTAVRTQPPHLVQQARCPGDDTVFTAEQGPQLRQVLILYTRSVHSANKYMSQLLQIEQSKQKEGKYASVGVCASSQHLHCMSKQTTVITDEQQDSSRTNIKTSK